MGRFTEYQMFGDSLSYDVGEPLSTTKLKELHMYTGVCFVASHETYNLLYTEINEVFVGTYYIVQNVVMK